MNILDQRLKHLLPKPNTEAIERAKRMVEAIYESIPSLDCKKCGECCGTITFSGIERLIIEEYVAKKGLSLESFTVTRNCPALDENNNCVIYQVRPMICRLYGVSEGLLCPYVEPEVVIPKKLAWECIGFCYKVSKELDTIGRITDKTVRWHKGIVRRLKKLRK